MNKFEQSRTALTVKMDNLDKESAKLLKVDELKSALKARGCSTSGKKAELFDRLATYFDAESIENQVSQVAESASNAILENDPKLEESKTSANSKEDPDSVKVALISSEGLLNLSICPHIHYLTSANMF